MSCLHCSTLPVEAEESAASEHFQWLDKQLPCVLYTLNPASVQVIVFLLTTYTSSDHSILKSDSVQLLNLEGVMCSFKHLWKAH